MLHVVYTDNLNGIGKGFSPTDVLNHTPLHIMYAAVQSGVKYTYVPYPSKPEGGWDPPWGYSGDLDRECNIRYVLRVVF